MDIAIKFVGIEGRKVVFALRRGRVGPVEVLDDGRLAVDAATVEQAALAGAVADGAEMLDKLVEAAAEQLGSARLALVREPVITA